MKVSRHTKHQEGKEMTAQQVAGVSLALLWLSSILLVAVALLVHPEGILNGY
jgi:hypothetical protein